MTCGDRDFQDYTWDEYVRDCKEKNELRQRIEELERETTQRGARMQIMREWMIGSQWDGDNPWWEFLRDYPEAEGWFDEDGVPVSEQTREVK